MLKGIANFEKKSHRHANQEIDRRIVPTCIQGVLRQMGAMDRFYKDDRYGLPVRGLVNPARLSDQPKAPCNYGLEAGFHRSGNPNLPGTDSDFGVEVRTRRIMPRGLNGTMI